MLAQSSSSQFSSAPVKVALPLTTSCALTWRDRKLFVRAISPEECLNLQGLQDPGRLVECLRRSPVISVELDSNLSPDAVLRWAEACGKAKKACYVKISTFTEILNKPNPLAWFLYKSFHRVAAIILAFVVLPVLLLPIMYFKMPAFSLHKQWVVNNQGRLLQMWTWQNQDNKSDLLMTIQFVMLTLINVIKGEILLGVAMPASLDKMLSL